VWSTGSVTATSTYGVGAGNWVFKFEPFWLVSVREWLFYMEEHKLNAAYRGKRYRPVKGVVNSISRECPLAEDGIFINNNKTIRTL
jgi:hypothetical protein